MGKFKIRSKTPQKEIIKTKIPANTDHNFELPPKKSIYEKTPSKEEIFIPKKSGLKSKEEHKVGKSVLIPQISKNNDKQNITPTNSGKKTLEEISHSKKNKSLPKIKKKTPKESLVRKFEIENDSLKKFNKKNVPLKEKVRHKYPSQQKNEKKIPPKLVIDSDPPKSKIKTKKPS